MLKINFLLTISIDYHEQSLWELTKWAKMIQDFVGEKEKCLTIDQKGSLIWKKYWIGNFCAFPNFKSYNLASGTLELQHSPPLKKGYKLWLKYTNHANMHLAPYLLHCHSFKWWSYFFFLPPWPPLFLGGLFLPPTAAGFTTFSGLDCLPAATWVSSCSILA